MKHNAVDTTLARRNLEQLRKAGITVERAYSDADLWALWDVEVLGHRYADAKLWIRLCSTHQGSEPYEQEYHLGRVNAQQKEKAA